MKRLNLFLLLLCFSLVLGGCSDSSNPSTPTQTRTINVNLPGTYLNSTNQTIALPAGKSCVIVTAGFDQSLNLKFQQYTFSTTTATGSPIKVSIPNLNGATLLSFVTEISIDQTFNNETSWSYASRTNMITATALRDTGNGTKTCYFDSNINEVTFNELIIAKSKTTFTTDIKKMIKSYCDELNIKLNQSL